MREHDNWRRRHGKVTAIMGKLHAVDYVIRARREHGRRREKFPRSAPFRYIVDIAVTQFIRIVMAIAMDFNILKQEMLQTIDDLQETIMQAEQQLNDDVPKDEEQVEASTRSSIQARLRRLGFMRTKLSRALHNAKGHWESALQAIVRCEEEDHRSELYREVRLHWVDHGARQAMGAAEDLLCHFDNAVQLLLNPLPLQLPQAEMPRAATPVRLSSSRMLQDTPALTDTGTRHEDRRPRETVVKSDHSLPPRQARSEEEVPSERRETLPRATPGFHPSCPLPLDFRLPEFTLPTFVGEIEKFPEFWDAFNSAIHSNPYISPVAKFHHLKSLLGGDAQAIVAGYDITAANYECAVNTLRETYYRPQLIRVQLSHRLKDMKPAGTSPLHQRTILAQIKSLWTQLVKLGDHEDNIFAMCLIREKFPPRTLEHLGSLETADPIPWKVPQLLAGLDRAIRTFETIADTMGLRSVSYQTLPVHSSDQGQAPVRRSTRQRSSSGDLLRGRSPCRDSSHNNRADSAHRKMQCAFCRRESHLTASCHLVVSREARMEVVIDENLCRKCFARGHVAAGCDAPPCSICGRGHHETLCRRKGASGQNLGDSHEVTRSVRARSPTPMPGGSASGSPTVYRRQSRSPSANSRNTSREVSSRISRNRSSSRNSRREISIARRSDPKDDLVARESEDSGAKINTTFSTSVNHSAPLSSDPRLIIVTSRSRNNITRSDETLVMLLDSGSEHSFIKEDTAKRLGLHLSEPCPITTRGFGGHIATEMSSIVSIVLRDQSDTPVRLRLRTRRVITSVSLKPNLLQESSEPYQGIDSTALQFSKRHEEVDVDILVGIDYYWSIIDPLKPRKLPSGLTLVSTRFGPVISGQAYSPSITATVYQVNTVSYTDETFTAMSVHSYVFQKETILCFADQDYRVLLQRALEKCSVPIARIIFLLTRASGLAAFLTRYLRAIETAQLQFIADLLGGEAEARLFILDIQQAPPANLPATEAHFVQSQWWRDNYSPALDHTKAKQFVDKVSAQAVEYVRSSPQMPTPTEQASQVLQPASALGTGMGASTTFPRSREDGPMSSFPRRGRRGRGPSTIGAAREVQPRRPVGTLAKLARERSFSREDRSRSRVPEDSNRRACPY